MKISCAMVGLLTLVAFTPFAEASRDCGLTNRLKSAKISSEATLAPSGRFAAETEVSESAVRVTLHSVGGDRAVARSYKVEMVHRVLGSGWVGDAFMMTTLTYEDSDHASLTVHEFRIGSDGPRSTSAKISADLIGETSFLSDGTAVVQFATGASGQVLFIRTGDHPGHNIFGVQAGQNLIFENGAAALFSPTRPPGGLFCSTFSKFPVPQDFSRPSGIIPPGGTPESVSPDGRLVLLNDSNTHSIFEFNGREGAQVTPLEFGDVDQARRTVLVGNSILVHYRASRPEGGFIDARTGVRAEFFPTAWSVEQDFEKSSFDVQDVAIDAWGSRALLAVYEIGKAEKKGENRSKHFLAMHFVVLDFVGPSSPQVVAVLKVPNRQSHFRGWSVQLSPDGTQATVVKKDDDSQHVYSFDLPRRASRRSGNP